jgi:hypothetical protein
MMDSSVFDDGVKDPEQPAVEEGTNRNILTEQAERRVFRAAYAIAEDLHLDLENAIALARLLTHEALRFAAQAFVGRK